MRIGIDCTLFDSTYVGGANTYVMGLLRAFSARPRQHKFVIFCVGSQRAAFEDIQRPGSVEIAVVEKRQDVLSRAYKGVVALALPNERLWKHAVTRTMSAAARQINEACDFLYCPMVVLPSYDIKVPTLLSMHDIQHVHHPDFFSWTELRRRSMNYDTSAKLATFFQASSAYIRDDIIEHYRFLSRDQFVVIPEGVDLEAFRGDATVDVRTKYDLPDRYLFLPAQLWKHKNHITLLKALVLLKKQHDMTIPLVMTGGGFSAHKEITEFIARNDMRWVRHLGKVPFADLIGLYRRAWFLVMPTLHESSSLPVLEAAASRLPILASDIPPIREMSRNLALNLFDPHDEAAIAACIRHYWDAEESRRAQIAFNDSAIDAYSWQNVADRYLDFFENALASDAPNA